MKKTTLATLLTLATLSGQPTATKGYKLPEPPNSQYIGKVAGWKYQEGSGYIITLEHKTTAEELMGVYTNGYLSGFYFKPKQGTPCTVSLGQSQYRMCDLSEYDSGKAILKAELQSRLDLYQKKKISVPMRVIKKE